MELQGKEEDSRMLATEGRGHDEQQVKARLWTQAVISVITGLAPLLIGFTYGFSSPNIPELLREPARITEEEASWHGSLAMLGTVLGSVVAVLSVDRLGRRCSLLLHCLPSVAGWALVVRCLQAAWTGPLLKAFLLTGRLLTGVAAGMAVITHPIYIAETSPKHIRGLLAVSFQVFIDLGILVVMALGMRLAGGWLAVVPLVLSVLLLLLLPLLPETPRWYVKGGRAGEAERALAWIRGPGYDVRGELREIGAVLASESSAGVSVADLRRPEVYRPLLLALGLAFFQQGCGVTAVVFYRQQICAQAGFSTNPEVIAVISSAVFLLSDLPSAALTDRAGRRVFLLSSALLMSVSHCLLGLYFYLTDVRQVQGLSALSLTGLLVFLVAFSLGMGPIVFVVLPEITPLHARGSIMGAAILVCYTMGFLITKEFSALQAAIGNYGTFWLFAGVTLLSVAFIAVFIPETKGRSLEQIEQYFRGRGMGEEADDDDLGFRSNGEVEACLRRVNPGDM